MSYLSDFKELNGGYVSFGGNPKGGKISGKGKIRIGKLDFDDVYFVKELMFDLFSVSQMCDKKNNVLFTDTECLVLSPEFKLPDENQVLLRVPRENNMYNLCRMKGIKREFSVPRTHQQNGIAERKNRTLIEATKPMLADSLLPILFWAEAVNTACYVQNRVLVTKPQNKTPYELLHELEDITYSDDEEDVGVEADFTNLKTSITVSYIPTTRVHKDHPVTQIIVDLSSATQTRSMSRVAQDQDGKSASTPIDTEKPLLKDPDGEDVDVHTYRSMIGSLIGQKKVIITEATIRDALRLDDAAGIDCLPNEEIFAELSRMGYEKPSTKLTFYKAFFSPQWKFLIHTKLQCMSAKRTSWNVFSSSMASAVICLSTVAQQVDEGAAEVTVDVPAVGVTDEGAANVNADVVLTASDEPSIPSPTPPTQPPPPPQDVPSTSHVQPTPPSSPIDQPPSPQQQPQPSQDAKISMDLLYNLLDICTTLTIRVENMEQDKIAQALEITKIDTSDDTIMDDVSKQRRIIAIMDADGRQAESQAQIYQIDLEHPNKVLSMQDDEVEPAELQEEVEVVTTTKLITKVVTATSAIITVAAPTLTTPGAPTLSTAPSAARRRKGVVIRDRKEIATPSTIIHTETKSKDKGKEILVEEPKPLKKENISTHKVHSGSNAQQSATYKRGLATIEEQLVTYKKNEVLFSEEVVVLKREVACKNYKINVLKNEFEEVKQEKEGIEFKIENFDNASKSLDKLIGSQITNNNKKGLGYHAAPLPHLLIYNGPTKLDLSYSGLDEFKEPEFKGYSLRDKQVSKDTSSFVESPLNVDKETAFSIDNKIEFVKPKNHDKHVKKSVSGCSRHMTRNIAYLSDFKEFDGGYVTFGEGAHGGRISGKG
nr:ribonuclease H-like domain-containing protein [Tanacetum cinerariifolium]